MFKNIKELLNLKKSIEEKRVALNQLENRILAKDRTWQEIVLLKDMSLTFDDPIQHYPLINISTNAVHLLAIKPEYHSLLFPDSILHNEDPFDIIKDVSHTNSITKIYLCKMPGTININPGDNLVIYRTSDKMGPALFRSVATSICVAKEIKSTSDFASFDALKNYCKNYSIFEDAKLQSMYAEDKSYYIIKMTYNIALKKRIIRKTLLELGINNGYWGCFEISRDNLKDIIRIGEVNESYIIN